MRKDDNKMMMGIKKTTGRTAYDLGMRITYIK